ncbi:MAG TPA: hypothetical protein VGD59_03295 [Acidisarcina sp.]
MHIPEFEDEPGVIQEESAHAVRAEQATPPRTAMNSLAYYSTFRGGNTA